MTPTDHDSQARPTGAGAAAPVRFLSWALALTLLDQAAKALVVARMAMGESFPVLGSVMSFTRQSNTGAFFSLFSSAGVALAVVGAVLVVVMIAWGCREGRRHPEIIVPLGLMLGGALGNLIDRVARGQVVDFLDFHFWPVFNIADIALTCGVLLMAYRLLLTPAGRGEASAEKGN
ncbi:MAG TPA: signal peptidase II [Armatimonadota bacterium]|jgi:signal peptidase II